MQASRISSLTATALTIALALGVASTARASAIIPGPDFDWSFPGALIKVDMVQNLENPSQAGWLQRLGNSGWSQDPVTEVEVQSRVPVAGEIRTQSATVPAAFSSHPLAAMLGQFHMNETGTRVVGQVQITGLENNTTYEIFVSSYRNNNNTARGTKWWLGPEPIPGSDTGTTAERTEAFRQYLFAEGTLLADIQNVANNVDPTNAMRVFNATSDGLGNITLYYTGTSSGTGNDNFTEGYFNGLVVIPEPSSLALLGLGGLMMLRRRRAL